jgi:hypothetical protein
MLPNLGSKILAATSFLFFLHCFPQYMKTLQVFHLRFPDSKFKNEVGSPVNSTLIAPSVAVIKILVLILLTSVSQFGLRGTTQQNIESARSYSNMALLNSPVEK